jgi:hypothetical protein
VFENTALRRIFGPKGEVVSGGWRKLHSDTFHNVYSSPNMIRMIRSGKIRSAGYVARTGEIRNAYKVMIGRS